MTVADLVRAVLRRLRPQRAPAWSRVEQVLAGAFGIPAEERPAYLDRACGDDAPLRAEVSALLAAADASGPLDQSIDMLLSPLLGGHDVPTAESAPVLVAHFELLARIAGGGMSVLYRARDTRLQRTVALKLLPLTLGADARAKSRFLLEARAAAALDHPNVCAIHEVGETPDGQLFISMPFYDGVSLADRLTLGTLTAGDAVAIGAQIARGLAHAHDRGIVHRDIKPDNLMLTEEGVVKILDFGIAKWSAVGLTRTGAAIGTLPYMSPERLRGGAIDARTDLWSLGVVLYEILAGRRPFDTTDEHLLRETIAFASPPSLPAVRPDVPEELCHLIGHLLAKHPDDRPDNAAAVADRLDSLGRRSASAPGHPLDGSAPPGSDDGTPTRPAPDTVTVLPEGERRQATVVILGLSGYAELVERCAAPDVDDLLRRLKRDTWRIAERHGGIVNEFGEDRVVLVFGVPISLEDHCVRATRAALELRAMIQTQRTARPVCSRLALHTAIDTGDTAVQRLEASIVPYRIAGRPMRRAAQLCAHARTDEILLTPEVERAVSAQFHLAPSNAVSLADEPTACVPSAVVAERTSQDRLDQMAGRDDLTGFTGRETELALLARAAAAAADGRGVLATVSGEAGLGKSRLLLELRRTLDERAAILIGRCSAYGQGTPYLPFLQMLRQVLRLAGPPGRLWTAEEVEARVFDIDPALVTQLPYYLRLLSIDSDRAPSSTPERDDQAGLKLMDALIAVFVSAARRSSCVLFLEDWHWADAASHDTLKRLAALVPDARLLVVVTTRAEQRLDLSNAGSPLRITLHPLAPDATAAMLRSVLAAEDVPPELVDRLQERTGGNPFFVEEVARSLIESGTVIVDAGRARVGGSMDALNMPANVQAVIRTRLERLDLDVRQLLRAAAVVGRDFTDEILKRVLADPDRVGPALAKLTAAGVIRQTAAVPAPAYAFSHALIQEAAYASLLEHQRADLHGRVGRALEDLHAGGLDDWLDRLAQHFSLAEDWPKASYYGVEAAERARRLHQFVDALRLLDRTREWAALGPAEELRGVVIDVLFRQERLCDLLGVRERQRQIADELVTMLEAGDDPVRLAEAYLHKGELHAVLQEFDAAETALEASLRLRREVGDALGERASLRGLGFLRWWQRRYADALECNGAALAIDRRHHRVSAIVGDLHNLGAVYVAMGRPDEARGCFEEGLALSEPARGRPGDTPEGLWEARMAVLYSFGSLLASTGDLDGALAYLGRGGEWSCGRGNPERASDFLIAAAAVYLKKGLIDDCLEHYRHAIEMTRANHLAPRLGRSLQAYAETLMALGREREALPALDEAARIHEALTDRPAEALSWSSLARASERLGNVSDAQAAWQRTADLCRLAHDVHGELDALEALGRIARRHLPSPVASRFYQEAIARATALEEFARAARLHNSAGIIEWTRGQHQNALTHFERARALFDTIGDSAGSGQMMNCMAASLSALGRVSEARDQLRDALAHHQRTGQPQLEAHALACFGDSCWQSGERADAASWYERSLQKRVAIGDKRGEGWMLQRLARARAAAGDYDAARQLLARAVGLATQCADEELTEDCAQLGRAMAEPAAR